MTVLLNKEHHRADFDCGDEVLNNYLKHQAGQDVKRKLSACFVWNNSSNKSIMGYYTLSAGSIPLDHIPAKLKKLLPPSYKSIPITLLGRFAIAKEYHRQGKGAILLIDALKRTYEQQRHIGSWAIVLDPKNEVAKQFYLKFGFIELSQSGKMFLPMATIQTLFV